MEWDGTWPGVVAMVVVCGLLGWFVPRVIARLPEPVPEEEDAEPADPEAADAQPADPEGDSPVEPQGDAVQAGGRAALPPAPPKEPYAVMAALPHLALRTALASAVIGGLCGLVVRPGPPLLPIAYLVPLGVALAFIDWRTTLLPTRLIAPSYGVLVVLVLVATALDGDLHSLVGAALGWAGVGGLFFLLWFIYPRGMGFGDVRLSGLLGILLGYLSWPILIVGVYAAFILGGVGGGLLSALRLFSRKRYPFGPFMLLGALVGVLFGPAILHGLGG